jgi:hypothetical protein
VTRYPPSMSAASPPEPPVPRLRPSPWLPIAGAIVGGLAGFAFYYFYGCDSG